MGKSEPQSQPGTAVPGYDDEFGSRLSSVVSMLGSRKAAAAVAGVTDDQLRKWVAGKARASFPAMAALCRATNQSLDWLATGAGPAPVDDSASTALPAAPAEGFVMVPRYNVEASAGHGMLNGDEHIIDYMAFRRDFVRRVLHVEPSNLALINAVGDSMEPAIRAGDLLLVDRGIDRIMDDAIYILGMGDELVVKRVQRFFDGGLTIKSDNPTYREQTIPPEATPQLRVAGRVRWIGRLI